jgi:hypothetical protein
MTLKEKLKVVAGWENELTKLQMQIGFLDDGAPIRAEVRDPTITNPLSRADGGKYTYTTVEVDEDELRALLRTSLESQIDALQKRLDGVVMTLPE